MISLVMTVKNEADTLPALWESIEAQTRVPDEVVIVDGGSSDGTRDFLESLNPEFELRFEVFPGNISQGRNRAVVLANGDIIAVTDGGCVLDSNWLEALESTLEGGADVASGIYYPLVESFSDGVFACVTLKAPFQFRPDGFMPSHRSIAYRREVFDLAGGYPEWLEYGEDMYFNHSARGGGVGFVFTPDAVAYWRMRQDLPSLMRQFERYAFGDGRASMYLERHLVRFGAYLIMAPLLVSRGLWGRLLALLGVLAYSQSRIRRIPVFLADRSSVEKLAAALSIPPLMALLDFSRMAGYLRGLYRRFNRGGRGP